MRFVNYIRFKHGNLMRGERCLYKGFPAVYLGSYVENKQAVDLMRIRILDAKGEMPVILEHVEQCTDRSLITCVKQQEKPMEGQMILC